MPMDKSRYPDNWAEISNTIRFERAQGRCEWCGAKHLDMIWRGLDNPGDYLSYDAESDTWAVNGQGPVRMSEIGSDFKLEATRVILTVHHVGTPRFPGDTGDKHDKMDCRPNNLVALCQRCHFIADLDSHIENARKSRIANKAKQLEANGQLTLNLVIFPDEQEGRNHGEY